MRLATVLALVLTAALAVPATAQQMSQPGTISVSGTGEITARPDTAIVTSGVTSQAETARAALDANTADMALLIETLKAAGIDARDIQTSGFSVNPNYVYSQAVDENGYTRPPRIDGYIVTNSVTIRVRDLAKLGAVLDQAVTVGANTINGISFSVADTAKLYDEARKQAFADAREKAALYAGVAGVDLGQIVSINESENYGGPQPYMMREVASAAPSAPVPVEAGELSYSINVQVTWSLGQP